MTCVCDALKRLIFLSCKIKEAQLLVMWSQWLNFCTTVLTVGKEVLEPSIYLQLETLLQSFKQDANTHEEALRTYFSDCPAHIHAVKTLDHSQFLNPLVLGESRINLGEILDVFSSKGPQPFGKIWLGLLDLAHAANPNVIDITQGKSFIAERMNTVAIQPTRGLGDGAPLEGILQSLIGSFPGLGDCMNNILQYTAGANPAEPESFENVLQQVQCNVLKPLMDGMSQNGIGVLAFRVVKRNPFIARSLRSSPLFRRSLMDFAV